jgi:sterol desaturase/sphingolipid hydroxylase (fatty acid hydroxylase superfamily)
MEIETVLRLGSFGLVFALISLIEALKPLRKGFLAAPRWWNNLGLTLINSLVLRFSLGALAYQTAVWTQSQGWGLLNQVNWPVTFELLLALLVFDLLIYFQHVLFHALPLFWRLHRVHHADPGFDASTGLRFHPLEILLSLVYKAFCVLALGPSPGAVLAFEILLNASSIFNHGNFRLPPWLEKTLRLGIITPDLHRIHHSQNPAETNSNYGFCLSLWDHLGGTYTAQAQEPQNEISLGLSQHSGPEQTQLLAMLLLPFKNSKQK